MTGSEMIENKGLRGLLVLLLGVSLVACAPPLRREREPAPIIGPGGSSAPATRPVSRAPVVPPRRQPVHPPATGEPASGPRIAAYTRVRPSEPTPPAYSSASRSLLSRAQRQQRDGDLDGAVSSIERALRIEPRNPHLWHRLAVLRLEQERFRLARELAEKSNALAGADQRLKRANWRLIADAWRALGEPERARRAQLHGD